MKPDSAVEIIQKLRQHGHEAYLVGGCVRDMVLGIEPSDYDIATSAHPEQVVSIFRRTEAIGAQFGVVLVIYHGHPFEVATFRSDDAYVDGRRPTGVSFTNAQQDVLRRDFTINGLLYDPISKEIIDYVSGRQDIQDRVIRAIGDPRKRFEEDKLRVLRAVRFGARLGYTIAGETWAAVCQMAPLIHQVSNERIREELVRILTEGEAARGVRMLEEAGLRHEILPEVHWSEQLDRALRLLHRGAAPDFAMAVLLHETPPADATRIVERLKFSRAEMQHTVSLVENLPKFATVEQMRTSALKRFFRLLRFDDHLELARIHAIATDDDLRQYQYASGKYQGWTREEIAPAPLISGDDLIQLGYEPGPLFKRILAQVEDEQLEGSIVSREQALDFVRSHYSMGGPS